MKKHANANPFILDILVPDSQSNYRFYFVQLSIEHYLHCSLAILTVFFFLLTNQLRVFWFFQLVWQGWSFLFSNIYFCRIYCSQTLKKVHRIASTVMFLGSLQVSGLPTSYLLSQVTLPKLLFQPAIQQWKYAKHAKTHSSHKRKN